MEANNKPERNSVTIMQPKPGHQRLRYRFRTGRGVPLTEEIARIEALASDRLADGASHQSVQTGARALLNLALDRLSDEFIPGSLSAPPVPTCPPHPDLPRYRSTEDP